MLINDDAYDMHFTIKFNQVRCYGSYDCLNKRFFSLFFKTSTEQASFKSSDGWFQRLGPPDEKERYPSLAVLEGGGTTRRFLVDDHRLERR